MIGLRAKTATSLIAGMRPSTGTFVVAVLILFFGSYITYPVVLILINSFNVADIGDPARWSLDNWRSAFSDPSIWGALGNTFFIYFSYTIVAFPSAVVLAWVLARTKVRWSYGLEFMFWVSFMMPSIATTAGWIILLDSHIGVLNTLLKNLPFIDSSPFEIYSVPGIIFAHLMGNAISSQVMLLTPAFRNMDMTLEEAARVSGASNLRTMMRVTLPVMVPPMVLVFMLNIVRIFQSFETEQILGTSIGFFVYSTKIYQFVRIFEPPEYGQATALASVMLILIAVIVPVQRWLVSRRQYTVLTGSFKPGLVDLGKWQPVVFGLILTLLLMLTVIPVLVLIGGSLMTRVGWFIVTPVFTLEHWQVVLGKSAFLGAFRTTLILSLTTAIISPLLFSMVAYVLVRTNWRGRAFLDTLFWTSAAIPGMLAGLGLLWVIIGTPGLDVLFGTIWILIIVIVLQGKLSGTQLLKGVYTQMGVDLEEAARVAGAGWLRTYFRIWVPLIMPTLILIGTLNFVLAAQTTSSIILLAARNTETLSILALRMLTDTDGRQLEQAGIVSLFIIAMTVVVALTARTFGLRLGVSHTMRRRDERTATQAMPTPPAATR